VDAAGLINGRFVKLGNKQNFSQDVETISPVGSIGLIMLEANVNYASESNNSASLWMYMNTINGTNTGYTKTGVSVVKIASLKHDFANGIVDCSLLGSESGDIITINKGGVNVFSYIDIPL